MSINETFNVGEIVKLKSGGPDMTILKVIGKDDKPNGYYRCQWFAGKKLDIATFYHETLVKAGNES